MPKAMQLMTFATKSFILWVHGPLGLDIWGSAAEALMLRNGKEGLTTIIGQSHGPRSFSQRVEVSQNSVPRKIGGFSAGSKGSFQDFVGPKSGCKSIPA